MGNGITGALEIIYNGSATSYNATGITAGAYRVQVTAYNVQNTSLPSDEIFVATGSHYIAKLIFRWLSGAYGNGGRILKYCFPN